jgi:hypothetical protein
MMVVFNIVTVYAYLSIATFILFIVVEMLNAMIKGPEYVAWMMGHKPEDSGPLTAKQFFLFLLGWPITAIMLARAMLKGHSLIEQMYLDRDEAKEKAEVEWQRKVEEALPLTAVWRAEPNVVVMGIQATVHAMMVEYPEPGKIDKRYRAVSHVVFEGPGKCLCFRSAGLSDYIPCASTDTLDEALTTCYTDKEWLRALAPGHERELDALARAMRARAATDPVG